ncbi:hypothetical protein MKW98_006296, partial [Papaver atlanticum]
MRLRKQHLDAKRAAQLCWFLDEEIPLVSSSDDDSTDYSSHEDEISETTPRGNVDRSI